MPTHTGPGDGSPDVGLIPQHQDGWQLDGEFSAAPDDEPEPAPEAGGPSGRGVVMPIGGAEDKLGRMTILREVVKLAGGPKAALVVISTASSLGDEITHAYLQLFGSLGVTDVVGIPPAGSRRAPPRTPRNRPAGS